MNEQSCSRVERCLLALSITVGFLLTSFPSTAVTILPGATVTKSTNSPLTAKLSLTTDVPSRVSISMTNGAEGWVRHFYDYGTTHSVFVYGFKPSTTNYLTLTVHDRFRNESTNAQPLVFTTDALPADFPTLTVLKSDPENMEPGYTLFRLVNHNNGKAYLVIVDSSGEVVWYSGRSSTAEVRQLPNGDLFVPLATSFVEFNLYGDTVRTWNAPSGLSVDFHDGFFTDHGTLLYLNDASRSVSNFPSSITNPNAPRQTTNVMYNRVIEISLTNASLLNTWSPINVLDPTRINYLTFTANGPLGVDCEHANAVLEDPRDDSIIVSMRHQDSVIKFDRTTGQLKWILGPHENWGPQWQPYLLTPVGSPFEWQYAQHAPFITPQGTLLIYDDGNYRASPFDPMLSDANNYSRAVEYSIDETNMQISQVWDFGRTNGEAMYTDRVGNADWLPQAGNVLITYGYVLYDNGAPLSPATTNATMVRIQEVTHTDDPQVVFDLACFDYSNLSPTNHGTSGYRSHRIPDLYGHLPTSVQDLTLVPDSGQGHLQFSADPVRSYSVQASTNLVDWVEIGTPSGDDQGNFDFDLPVSIADASYFFRVASW